MMFHAGSQPARVKEDPKSFNRGSCTDFGGGFLVWRASFVVMG